MSQITSVALLTLAAQTGILAAGPVMTRGGKLLSVRGTHVVRDLTAGDGPFQLLVIENGLSLALAEQFLEIGGPVSPDVVADVEKQSRGRSIRTLGVLQPMGDGTVCSLYLDNVSLKGFAFGEENAGWSYLLYNLGKTLTTGASWFGATQHFTEFNPSG